ncbi:hypothetical protein AB0K78_19840, partial [Streptomyces albidoflavus]
TRRIRDQLLPRHHETPGHNQNLRSLPNPGRFTVTGELRHSNVQARKGESEKLITVSFCQNESEAFSREVKTGKVLKDQGSEEPYYAYSVLMEKSTSIEGFWQAKTASATKGAAQCA